MKATTHEPARASFEVPSLGSAHSQRLHRRDLLASLGVLFIAAGCGHSKDAPSNTLSARVVSVSPSMTETVFAVGAGASLVGRTSFCDYPPEASKAEVVGGFTDISVEKVIALAPTLVVGERRPGGRDLDRDLASKGIATFFPEMRTVAQIEDMVSELGARLRHVTEARDVVAAMKSKVEQSRARVQPLGTPRTLFLFDFHPLVAAGPDAFPNELLALAGAANVVSSGGEYPRLSPEGVLSLDPDVIIDGSAGAYSDSPEALLRAVPGLSGLRALKNGAVQRLRTNAALRPGPRIGDGVAELADIVHPKDAASSNTSPSPARSSAQ